MNKHIFSAISLSLGCFGLSIFLSDAPARVHIVDALSLLIAFTLPTALIKELQDIKNKRGQIIFYWLSGTLIWFFLLPRVVVKTDLNVKRLAVLIAISFIGIIVFISLHLIILKITANHNRTENISENE
jgi:hypothetical protein